MGKVQFSSVEIILFSGRTKEGIRKTISVDQYEAQRNRQRQRHSGGPTRSTSKQKRVSHRLRSRASANNPRKIAPTNNNSNLGQGNFKRNLKSFISQSRFADEELAAPKRASERKGCYPRDVNLRARAEEQARSVLPKSVFNEDDNPTSDTCSGSSSNDSRLEPHSSIELELAHGCSHGGRGRFSRAMDTLTRRPGTLAYRREWRSRSWKRWSETKINLDDSVDRVPLLNIQEASTREETEVALITPTIQHLRLFSIDGNEPDEDESDVTPDATVISEEIVEAINFLSSLNCGSIATHLVDSRVGGCIGLRLAILNDLAVDQTPSSVT